MDLALECEKGASTSAHFKNFLPHNNQASENTKVKQDQHSQFNPDTVILVEKEVSTIVLQNRDRETVAVSDAITVGTRFR